VDAEIMNRQSMVTAGTQPIVQVIATTVEGTRAALATAVPLALGSLARLVVLVPRIDPCPAAGDEPADFTDFLVKRYQDLASGFGGEATVVVCACRRLSDMAAWVVDPDATIVVGGRSGRWLMSPEERLASRLTRSAKRVIFVASGPTRKRRPIAPVAAVLAAVVISGGAETAVAHPAHGSRMQLLALRETGEGARDPNTRSTIGRAHQPLEFHADGDARWGTRRAVSGMRRQERARCLDGGDHGAVLCSRARLCGRVRAAVRRP
jgi:hypothetical protein